MPEDNINDATLDVTPAPVENIPAETLNDVLNSVSLQDSDTSAYTNTPPASPTPTSNPPAASVGDDTITLSKTDLDAIYNRLDANEQRDYDSQMKADINNAIETVKKTAEHVDPLIIEGLLHAKAANDTRFAKAFENRHKDPSLWNKILDKVGEDLVTRIPNTTAQINEDVNALNSIPAGSTPTQGADWDGLSDAEFNQKFNNLTRTDGYT